MLNEPTQQELASIKILFTQGRLKEVLSAANLMLKHFPKSVFLYNILGATNAGLKNFDSAIANYKKAIKIKPDFADAFNNIGAAYKSKGNFLRAIENYKHATKINPKLTQAYNNIGNIYQERGELNLAIENYKKAIKIKPDFAEAHNNIGNVLRANGDLQKAIESYDIATKINSLYSEAFSNKGNTFRSMGKLEKAIECYNQAIKINPGFAEAYNNMGNVYKSAGKQDKAIKNYKQAINLKSNFTEAYNNMGNALMKNGDLQHSKEAFQKAMKIEPENLDSIFGFGLVCKKLGFLHEAGLAFKKVLEKDRKDLRGTTLQMATLGMIDVPDKTPKDHLKSFYKNKSIGWGKSKESYFGNELIKLAIKETIPKGSVNKILDLGCGTGSLAKFLSGYTKVLDGVDLSEDMLSKAKSTYLYNNLYETDLIKFLNKTKTTYDLILVAATLIHFKKLDEIFSLIHNKLNNEGKFVFSVFDTSKADFELNEFQMFSHSKPYIKKIYEKLSFISCYTKRSIHEYHGKDPVYANIFVLEK